MAHHPAGKDPLTLNFQGRIIDHLGLQMYQSPVAAVAELVSNSWDAEVVEIETPANLGDGAVLVVRDDGNGMTYDECDRRFLNAGYNTRGGDPNAMSKNKGRPLLGRKGIGKFAGFGIARKVTVDTTGRENGERTVFEMDLDKIRGNDDAYVGPAIPIEVVQYEAPDEARKEAHGTTITLSRLSVSRRPSAGPFAASMARRFLLHQEADDFEVKVDGHAIPKDPDLGGVQFTFPSDYEEDERPEGLEVEDGWALEDLGGSSIVRWRVRFYQEPIQDDELNGVAVFAEGKLAQRPFFFNLTGGVEAQHGMEYLSGQVDASYVDHMSEDVISTERQRINWEHPATSGLESWGQERVKSLLKLWRKRRNEEKEHILEDRLSPFKQRLDRLQPYERSTVKGALTKLAQIPRLSTDRFKDMAGAILNAWDVGRLRGLIQHIANVDEIPSEMVLEIMNEAEVLTALSMAETVKAKQRIIAGLEERIRRRELENDIRDYIAEHPWLLSPEWQTYRIERSLAKLLADAADEADREFPGVKGTKRVDLALSGGSTLVVVEFMRPEEPLDMDHVNRFEYYADVVRTMVEANTSARFTNVEGLLVADRLTRKAPFLRKINRMKDHGLLVSDWDALLGRAKANWHDYFETLVGRAPEDERMRLLTVATNGEGSGDGAVEAEVPPGEE